MKSTKPIEGPGMRWAMQAILAHFDKVAPRRKIKAIPADPELDEMPRCYICRGDSNDCSTCAGAGNFRHEDMPSVITTLRRGFDDIPVQISISDGKILDAWVTENIGEPGELPRYNQGMDIPLFPEEEMDALRALQESK